MMVKMPVSTSGHPDPSFDSSPHSRFLFTCNLGTVTDASSLLGSCHLCGSLGRSSRFLAFAWPAASSCRHLESEPVDRSSLLLYLSSKKKKKLWLQKEMQCYYEMSREMQSQTGRIFKYFMQHIENTMVGFKIAALSFVLAPAILMGCSKTTCNFFLTHLSVSQIFG